MHTFRAQTESNDNMNKQFSSIASSILKVADDSTNSMMLLSESKFLLLLSIQLYMQFCAHMSWDSTLESSKYFAAEPLRSDHEAFKKLSILSACCEESVKGINSIHFEKVANISETARRYLLDDYMVCSKIKFEHDTWYSAGIDTVPVSLSKLVVIFGLFKTG